MPLRIVRFFFILHVDKVVVTVLFVVTHPGIRVVLVLREGCDGPVFLQHAQGEVLGPMWEVEDHPPFGFFVVLVFGFLMTRSDNNILAQVFIKQVDERLVPFVEGVKAQ